MPIECAPCIWPTVLDERGPAEDPSILLTGTARVGDATAQVVAIRINPAARSAPAYRDGVPRDSYREGGFDSVIKTIIEDFEYVQAEFENLLGESQWSVVELATGTYRLWLVPASFTP